MGRKPDTDVAADRRLGEAWRSKQHKTYAGLAKAVGLKTAEVALVADVDVDHQRINVTLTRDAIEHSQSIDSADIALAETLPTIWIM